MRGDACVGKREAEPASVGGNGPRSRGALTLVCSAAVQLYVLLLVGCIADDVTLGTRG